jgi:hypothetical protein
LGCVWCCRWRALPPGRIDPCAAADIEGHSAAAELGEPGRLTATGPAVGKCNLFMGIDVGFWNLADAPMSDEDQLQNRSARLVAMAVNARNEGHLDYAHRVMQRASEILNHPTAFERLGTHARSPRSRSQHHKAD